ncbi:hypothetical protein [Lewinella sp. W8]|uniref:hypothetical protein n=1 Tax=Lewinella sp. W8 TaxID=2528208 RepID=UPI001068BBB6|nr:hypothetical protein [Lewinella sp. W8]MTB50463.1 hypothetical protein [Lewinella sp. W8]
MQHKNSLEKANQVLAQYAVNLGDPVYPGPDEVKKTLAEFEFRQTHDSFFLYFDVRQSRIKRVGSNLKKVLGISHLDWEGWMGLIHPDFVSIYTEFGFAAYQASLKYAKEIKETNASYSINLPLQRTFPDGTKEYWLVKQSAYPFEFDANGMMVSHLNTYTLISRFDQYTPMQPFVLFDYETQDEVGAEIRALTRKSVMGLFYPQLATRHQTTLLSYWEEFSKFKFDLAPMPNSLSIAEQLKKSQQTILDYNKAILEASRESFPLSEFTDIRSVVSFLFHLFGPVHQGK